jgi:hypothetical protein
MIHMASVWVPFTSESKEAVADYDEIRKEMKLALMECGRKLGTYLRKRLRMRREGERRDVFQKYIGEIAKAIHAINGTDPKRLFDALLEQAKKKTAVADLQLDEEGKRIKDEDPADQEGVIIVESARGDGDAPPAGGLTKAQAAALKVAAMAKDDAPRLIPHPDEDARTRRPRETAKKPAKGDAGKRPDASRPTKPSPKSADHAKPQLKPESKANPKAKPKMRLVNGKLVPVDEGPGLF